MKTIAAFLASLVAIAALSACEVPEEDNKDSERVSEPKKDKDSEKAEPKFTVAQESAIRSAESYLEMSGFSRAGLIDQLSSKVADGYSVKLATFAVDHLKVDWNKEAVQSAKSYLDMSGFSRQGLIDQLSSPVADQFTVEQATYAANKVGL